MDPTHFTALELTTTCENECMWPEYVHKVPSVPEALGDTSSGMKSRRGEMSMSSGSGSELGLRSDPLQGLGCHGSRRGAGMCKASCDAATLPLPFLCNAPFSLESQQKCGFWGWFALATRLYQNTSWVAASVVSNQSFWPHLSMAALGTLDEVFILIQLFLEESLLVTAKEGLSRDGDMGLLSKWRIKKINNDRGQEKWNCGYSFC